MLTEKELDGVVHAPEFPAELDWLNIDKPLKLETLRGKFVLLDFWTFCCINCMHILPDLRRLEEKFPDVLVVIGVHSAKFTNEKDTDAIRQAIRRHEIHHPVVNDKDFRIWNEYGVRAWPSLVLINPVGRVIGIHSGEGAFQIFDPIISMAIPHFDGRNGLRRSTAPAPTEINKGPKTLLSFPGKVIADPSTRRLFIADTNHNRILITTDNGDIVDVIGEGSIGQKSGAFEQATFHHPQGLALDGDSLYIADTENHLVRVADLKERTVKTVLGSGRQAREFNKAGAGRSVDLNSPWDLLFAKDALFIAMAGNHQIWTANPKTWQTEPYAGSSREGRIDGPLLQAALAQPSGLATDGEKLFVADSEVSAVRSIDLHYRGRVETMIGKDLFEFGDEDGSVETARLQHPLGVAWRDGLVYVADTYNSKVKSIDPIRKTSLTLAGTGKKGSKDGELLEAEFSEPSGLTVIGDKIFVADTNNHRIRVIDLVHKSVSTLELRGLERLKNSTAPMGRTVTLESQKLRSEKGVVIISVPLGPEYKLSPGAPHYLDWSSENTEIVSFSPKQIGGEKSLVEFPLRLLTESKAGQTTLIFDAVIYYCSTKSAACYFDRLKLKVPVEVSEGERTPLEIVLPLKL